MRRNYLKILLLCIEVFLLGIFFLIRPSSYFSFAHKEDLVYSQTTKKVRQDTLGNSGLEQANLEKYLKVEAALLGVNGNISLYFKYMNHVKEISIDSTRSWIPASIIKAFVVLEAFRQRKVGLINFDQRAIISADNVVPTELETDEFPILGDGVNVSIRQLVETMITQSDNTAYNTLLDILDRRNINATLRALGMTETVVGEKLNLDDRQFQNDLVVPGRQPNTTTVKDVAILFDLLYNRQVPDADEMLSIFKRQKINYMLPALLPKNVIVAHKTGEWSPIFHDGGVIYKPQDPFVLVVFTNSGNPNVLARLAKVAYYNNAESVGQNVSANRLRRSAGQRHPHIYLASSTNQPNILGVQAGNSGVRVYTVESGDSLWSISEKFYGTGENWVDIARRNYITNPQAMAIGTQLFIPSLQHNVPSEKFPKITASDLGITSQDLSSNPQDIQKVADARITPSSIFYPLKRFLENARLIVAKTKSEKIHIYLSLATHRLSEMKALLVRGKTQKIDQLLSESEKALAHAAQLAEYDKDQDSLLLQVKQLSDLHFVILGQYASKFHGFEKEAFVEGVYQFYQKNSQEIVPIIKKSVISSLFEQQPYIGTVSSIHGNNLAVQFADGQTKEVILSDLTKTRAFNKNALDDKNALKVGSKIAMIGHQQKEGRIVPLFILRDIPKELPDKHEGSVLEIDPSKNILKIQDKSGKKEEIEVNNKTVIRARDTAVSLEGIKAGSQVTVFGEGLSTGKTSEGSSTPTFKATTITVTNNSSGSQEKVETSGLNSSGKETPHESKKEEEKTPTKEKKEDTKPTEPKK